MNIEHRSTARAFNAYHHYWYARWKFAIDPLYAQVGAALSETQAPLLDLGCGIGLLAHTLRAQGFAASYVGFDNDNAKISAAVAAARHAQLANVQFVCLDLANAPLPAHRGSVAVLDMLQFMAPDAGVHLIEQAATCITPDARLVIRTGLEDANARTRFTRAVDVMSKHVGWMNATPIRYPTQASLTTLLTRCGLRAEFTTQRGLLPFNNWLVVAKRVEV